MTPELWGQSRRVNRRRRFYKVVGRMPPPFGLVLCDYTEIYNAVDVEYDAYDDDGLYFLGKQRTGQVCDVQSQADYGMRPVLLGVGPMRQADADCLRDVFLERHASPTYDIERA